MHPVNGFVGVKNSDSGIPRNIEIVPCHGWTELHDDLDPIMGLGSREDLSEFPVYHGVRSGHGRVDGI